MTTMFVRTLLAALILSAVLVACGDRYRYPCQDPANAGSPACQYQLGPKPAECTTTTAQRTKNKALGVTGSTLYGPAPC